MLAAAGASSYFYPDFPIAQYEAFQPEAQPVLCTASGRCIGRLQCSAVLVLLTMCFAQW